MWMRYKKGSMEDEGWQKCDYDPMDLSLAACLLATSFASIVFCYPYSSIGLAHSAAGRVSLDDK